MGSPPSPHTPENWGAATSGYARSVAPLMMAPFAEALIERMEAHSQTEALEVAAGTGALTEPLAARVRSLLATDFAPQMVDVLRERMARTGATNVRVEVMDGQALDLEDGSFDAAACSFALMLFPDRARGFSELCRVLRPGGRAVVSGWTTPDRFEAFGLFLDAVRSAFPDMPTPEEPPPVFSLSDPSTFRDEMEAAGFREVQVDLVARELEVPDFGSVWAMMTSGAPPVKVLFDRIGEGGRARLKDAVAAIVEERFGGGPVTLTNVATVGVGVAA